MRPSVYLLNPNSSQTGTAEIDRAVSPLRSAELKPSHGADVLVMGCPGVARYRAALEKAVGIPVVGPTQAVVAMVAGHVRLSQARTS